MNTPVDVAVVGAGPAGLSAAILAAREGLSVALVAPRTIPTDRRTVAMLGVSVDILQETGIWPALADTVAPLRTMRIVDGTRRLVRAPLVEFHASEIGRDAFGYNVPTAAMIAALEDAVTEAGILRLDGLARAITVHDGHVAIDAGAAGSVSARLVGAADGRNSPVREAAGIGLKRWSYPQTAVVANIRHSLPHGDVSTEFHTETGPFTLVPLPGLRSAVVCVVKPREAERLMQMDDRGLAEVFEQKSHFLVGDIEIDGPRQAFPLTGQSAERFAARRIALIGEAAHVFPPIGAQGLNLSLRDAAAFARTASVHRADPGGEDALADYHRRRSGDVYTRTAAVDALNRTLLTSFLPVQAARGVGLFALDRLPALKRFAMRQALAPHL
ncbi:UbiH/UbiF family hydroxylase [Kaistia geumhonensis]|uniref:2-octaprenyl-6-methoxyphenol hydroxylase n=1 Tax=Kaistia geumhonensis TaxID=410839 RepID=A0ABU0M171_9HYPH|nr:UbiH/UbiF family hydroxylase [Kaistia geumhonensis]MCX5480068.1 UbiH/UbiF family hydroxylase [Kaistia geumhonensis]MDQ0514704.1 2-octaprenyl-6-methoxyphenol hydroxylase [Kaistia geumhonensis]